MIRIAVKGEKDLTVRLQTCLKERALLKNIDAEEETSNVKKVFHFVKSIKDYKYVLIYAYPKMWVPYLLAKLMGKKVIFYWIGTDCYFLQKNKKSFIIKRGDINIAHSLSLQKELRAFNIATDILTVLPQNIDLSIGKMPKEHAVLFYIPEGREDFYGYTWIVELIKHFPQLAFHIVANGKTELFPYENAIVHGTISAQEMNKLYNEISIVVRFPEHDSLSISIMEAMFKAKTIIYRYEQECTIQAKTLNEFIQRLEEVISKPPQFVLSAREYALSHFTNDIVCKQFDAIVKKHEMKG